jgi:ABC-2 type transport system permease protein
MKQFVTLIRREFWEHRGLWMAPLIAAGFLIAAVALSGFSSGGFRISIDDQHFNFAQAITADQKAKLFGVGIAALGLPILITMVVVVFFYLADAMYGERKDRSILFWKSMPVSDSATVWSKVATALAVVPVYAWFVGMLTVTLGFLIGSIRVSGTPIEKFVAWDTGIWLQVQAIALANMLVASLWYAPVAGYMLAVSAWARRSVLMWITLPPVLLVWLEEIIFKTKYIAAFIGYRLSGFFQYLGRDSGPAPRGPDRAREDMQWLSERLDSISAIDLLGRIELWAGVLVAAGLIFIAIRMRRYRDDT